MSHTFKHLKDHTVKVLVFFLLAFAGLSFTSGSADSVSQHASPDPDSLYKPVKKDVLLFYIQLSENHNIIVYDINYGRDKTVDGKNPVHTYWIRYSDKGQNQELSYFQRHLVYGLESKLIDTLKQTFLVHFVSYKKKSIYLVRKDKTEKYYPCTSIQGKMSVLSKIFIQVEPRTFGLPKVRHVELHGRELTTNKYLIEKIIP